MVARDLSAWQWQRPVEEFFTVAHYDHRGAGKTHRANDPDAVAGNMAIARFVDDAIEVAEHLRVRYGKKTLVLAGHSWGTVVAGGARDCNGDLRGRK